MFLRSRDILYGHHQTIHLLIDSVIVLHDDEEGTTDENAALINEAVTLYSQIGHRSHGDDSAEIRNAFLVKLQTASNTFRNEGAIPKGTVMQQFWAAVVFKVQLTDYLDSLMEAMEAHCTQQTQASAQGSESQARAPREAA